MPLLGEAIIYLSMVTIREAVNTVQQRMQTLYDAREAAAITNRLLEWITGKNRLDILTAGGATLTEGQETNLYKMLQQLESGRPLQYVTGMEWFMGMAFQVNESVLIPRPETEELVQWIITEHQDKPVLTILDIGTGSGCMAIALKKRLPDSRVTAVDISEAALVTARSNAAMHNTDISLIAGDILAGKEQMPAGGFDIIVSNPPYIPMGEKAALHPNVAAFEPTAALFTPDDDPLIFYKAIALYGITALKQQGMIYCELHRDFADAAVALFRKMDYQEVVLRNDIHGNPRMLRAGSAIWYAGEGSEGK